jgi:hypothetical protein
MHTQNSNLSFCDKDLVVYSDPIITDASLRSTKTSNDEISDKFKKFTESLIANRHDNKVIHESSRDIVNLNGLVIAHVGDVDLEAEYANSTTIPPDPTNTTSSTSSTSSTALNFLDGQDLIIYKRDFMILHVFNTNMSTTGYDVELTRDRTKYTTYGVYAMSVGALTQVVTMNIPLYSEIPILDLYDSMLNPYDVVNLAYQYQTSRNRTLILKKSYNVITNPHRDFLINLNLITTPRPDILSSTDINYNNSEIPLELIDLAILIRSNKYISRVSRDLLLNFALNITIF